MNSPVNLGMSNLESEEGGSLLPLNQVIATPPPAPKAGEGVLAKYAKRRWIVLEDNDNIPPTGQFFGHNGNGFMLQAGRAALVPVEIIDILNHAEYLAPVVDPQTRQVIDYKPRLRFPYRVVTGPEGVTA